MCPYPLVVYVHDIPCLRCVVAATAASCAQSGRHVCHCMTSSIVAKHSNVAQPVRVLSALLLCTRVCSQHVHLAGALGGYARHVCDLCGVKSFLRSSVHDPVFKCWSVADGPVVRVRVCALLLCRQQRLLQGYCAMHAPHCAVLLVVEGLTL